MRHCRAARPTRPQVDPSPRRSPFTEKQPAAQYTARALCTHRHRFTSSRSGRGGDKQAPLFAVVQRRLPRQFYSAAATATLVSTGATRSTSPPPHPSCLGRVSLLCSTLWPRQYIRVNLLAAPREPLHFARPRRRRRVTPRLQHGVAVAEVPRSAPTAAAGRIGLASARTGVVPSGSALGSAHRPHCARRIFHTGRPSRAATAISLCCRHSSLAAWRGGAPRCNPQKCSKRSDGRLTFSHVLTARPRTLTHAQRQSRGKSDKRLVSHTHTHTSSRSRLRGQAGGRARRRQGLG